MRHRLILFLVFGAILVALGEWDAQSRRFGFAGGLSDAWREFCVANSPDKIGKPAVSLVRINDEYQPAIGKSLSQADYAAILGFVEGFDPKSVAFEPNPVFDPAEPINQTTLELLKEVALILPPLTLGAVAENGQGPQSDEEAVNLPVIANVEGDVASVTPVTRIVAAPNPQLTANGAPAFTAIELAGDHSDDAGGRRVNLIGRHGDQVVPSFIVHALANYTGVGLDQVSVQLPPAVASGVIRIGDVHEIPIDARGRMKIYEQSGIGTSGFYPAVSAFHLALTGEDDETIKSLLADVTADFETLKTNLVVVGHDRTEDRRETLSTARRQLSRAEMITRAIATIQSGRYIDWWPLWARLLGVLVIAGIAALAFTKPRGKAIIWAVFGGFFYFGVSMVIFKSTLTWAPPFAPMALFVLMIVVALVSADPARAESSAPASGSDKKKDDAGSGKLAAENPAT
jgi:hypothetical protein